MSDLSDLIERRYAYIFLTEYYNHRTEEQHKNLKVALSRVSPAQPDVPDKNVGDLIRRQDAIDAVCMDGCGLCRDAIEQIGGGND